MAGTDSKDSVDIFSILDPKTGHRVAQPYLTPNADQREKNIYTKLPAVIPVVFLPGIMGTNLKIKGKRSPAWRPPNVGLAPGELWETVAAMWTWGTRGSKERQGILNKSAVEVDESGPISVGDSGLSEKLARERGWGSVMRKSYHPVMALMQQRLNAMAGFNSGAPLKDPKPSTNLLGDWKTSGMISPAEYGEQRGLPSLTEEEIVQAARYHYDVWCGGYNWLQSNRDSGEDIKDYIEKTVLAYYKNKKVPADKVIVVSHSMGGMVSRALTEIHGYDKVLGVVSGVQPATGAPSLYHHMRCGYEGASQLILGRNAKQVTAVVANSPGALELAPTFDHDNGKPWLFVTSRDGKNEIPPLPVMGDPYGEIYTNSAWYGLVPSANTEYLDLSGKAADPNSTVEPRGNLDKIIGDVSKFHRDFSKKYHAKTYAHYGADSRYPSWQTIHWKGNAGLLSGFKDDGNGSYVKSQWVDQGSQGHYDFVKTLEITPGLNGSGDETVSETSGVAPGAAGARASFRHGNLGEGEHNTEKGYVHSDAYQDERAQWAALYSIIKIAQDADWHAA